MFQSDKLGFNAEARDNCLFSCYISLMMTIEQTVAIPADYPIFLELPRSIPIGANARVSISIPTVFDNQNGIEPVNNR